MHHRTAAAEAQEVAVRDEPQQGPGGGAAVRQRHKHGLLPPRPAVRDDRLRLRRCHHDGEREVAAKYPVNVTLYSDSS